MLTRRHEDEGASARDAGPLFENHQQHHSDGETAKVKRLATAAAELALKGYSLHPAEAGAFVVSRWNCFKNLADLPAVEQFVQRVAP